MYILYFSVTHYPFLGDLHILLFILNENCQKIQDPKETEKSSWQGKKHKEKEQNKCFKEEIVDVLFESNIN